MKTILITGITGTVGAYTALYLKNKGYTIIGAARRPDKNGFFAQHGIEYISTDVTKPQDLALLEGKKIDVVIHLAGAMPAAMEGYHPQQYIDTIMTGTLNVLEFIRYNHIPKIIFAQQACQKYTCH